jgi:hypothetical protein
MIELSVFDSWTIQQGADFRLGSGHYPPQEASKIRHTAVALRSRHALTAYVELLLHCERSWRFLAPESQQTRALPSLDT